MTRWAAYLLALSCACGDNMEPTIRGSHHFYVMSRQLVPMTNAQAREYALDIGGSPGGEPDGVNDNQLGMVLGGLQSALSTEPQAETDRLVDNGGLLQLIDVQLPEPEDGPAAAGFSLHVGTNPQPPPCADEDTTCRRHLLGGGVFEVHPSSPHHPGLPSLSGPGQYLAGPGRLSVVVGFLGTPIRLDMIGARVSFSDPAAIPMLSGVICGGVRPEDVREPMIPAVQQSAMAVVRRDCSMLDMPPRCGCMSSGKFVLELFDRAPQDCTITVEEIASSLSFQGLFTLDVRIDGIDLLSFGFGFEALPAEIAP